MPLKMAVRRARYFGGRGRRSFLVVVAFFMLATVWAQSPLSAGSAPTAPLAKGAPLKIGVESYVLGSTLNAVGATNGTANAAQQATQLPTIYQDMFNQINA